jgi:catecholate siderophore receptor
MAMIRSPFPPRRSPLPLVLASILAAAAPAALAGPAPAPDPDPTPVPDMPAAHRETARLDAVRVNGHRPRGYAAERTTSATRTDTPLQDVPQAITVITGEQIHDRSVQSMSEAVRYVPGIGITQGEGNRDGLVFRGNSSTADFFVDGMRDDVQYYRDTYNIERIEAFKGPNAMIFGRGSPGGLLNRVTRVADGRESAQFSAQVGSWDKRRLTGDVGHAFDDDASIRVTGVWEDSGGHRDDVVLQRIGLNPTFAFLPGENTRIVVGYEYFRDERTADRGVPSRTAPVNGTRLPVDTDPSIFFGDPDGSFADIELHALTALVEHDFGGGTVLRNRTRYADYDKLYRNVFPGAVNQAAGTVALSAYQNGTERRNLFNQTDLVFSHRFGTVEHKFMIGTEYGRQASDNLRRTGTFTVGAGTPCLNTSATGFAASCSVPLSDPNVRADVTYASSATDADNRSVVNLAAVYAQDQIVFSPHWSAVLGVRYDRFEVDVTDRRAATAPANRRLSSRDDLLSPRAGLVFKPIDALSLYAGYGVTYLPRSGEQLGSLAVNNQSLDPEKFENRELGAKWEVRTGLFAEAAVYRLERSNAAVVDPADPTRLVLLDGDSQRIDGAELSLSGAITDDWKIVASYAWQDARTVQAVGTTPAGRTLPQTPETALGLWNRIDLSDRWGFALGASYRSASFASISNAVTLKSYTRWDAAVYCRFNDRVSAQINLENIFDKAYFASAHSDNNITPGAPRAAWLTLDVKF